ncbi:MAG: hypothetical protein RIF32_12740 [Leptospirales bacterium]|jgi:hypothetical protein
MLRRLRLNARIYTLLLTLGCSIVPDLAPAPAVQPKLRPARAISETQAEILRRIQLRGRRVFENFAGIAGRRHSLVRVYDGETRTLKHTIRLTADRKDYYEGLAEVTVLRYSKGERELPPSEFGYHEFEAPLPLFDEHGEKNYRFRLLPAVRIEGRLCHRLQVLPRANTKRHFRGDLYFAVDSLELKYLKGSYARLQIGLRSFWFAFHFREHPLGVPVFTRGRAEGRVYFPLIRDEFVKSEMRMERQEPIRRGPDPQIRN